MEKQEKVSELEKPQMYHGVEGGFRREGNSIFTSCIFSYHEGALYACQDKYDGAPCPEKFGRTYSWVLTEEIVKVPLKPKPVISNQMSRRLYNVIITPEAIKGKHMEVRFLGTVRYTDSERRNIMFSHTKPLMGHHFDLRDGEISYCPNNKEQLTGPSGGWVREGRLVAKTGKFIASLIDTRIAEFVLDGSVCTDIKEDFRSEFISFCEAKSGIVKGTAISEQVFVSDDPTSIYQMHYATDINTGALSGSCMRPGSDHTCRYGAPWYTMIGAKIAYLKDERNKLLARALLWDDCEWISGGKQGTTFKFMDRIYGNEASTALMKEWAHENGYGYKMSQDSHSINLIFKESKGTATSDHFRWTKRIAKFSKYSPYLDTVIYLNKKTGCLQTKSEDYTIQLQSTSAGCFQNLTVCPNCGGVVYRMELLSGRSIKGCAYCLSVVTDYQGRQYHVRIEEAVEYYDALGNRQCRERSIINETLVQVRAGRGTAVYCVPLTTIPAIITNPVTA